MCWWCDRATHLVEMFERSAYIQPCFPDLCHLPWAHLQKNNLSGLGVCNLAAQLSHGADLERARVRKLFEHKFIVPIT